MDSTALLSVVGGALLLSIIVTSLCTYCWGYKQPTSIPQRSSDSSPEYNSTFLVRHPQSTYTQHTDHTISSMPFLPHNSLSSPSIIIPKVHSCPPSETGSQASYVNQSDNEDKPYITVLPDPPSERSRASSQSSGGETYINETGCDCVEDSDSDGHNYENFNQTCFSVLPGLSSTSLSSNERGSSDYVNTDPNSK